MASFVENNIFFFGARSRRVLLSRVWTNPRLALDNLSCVFRVAPDMGPNRGGGTAARPALSCLLTPVSFPRGNLRLRHFLVRSDFEGVWGGWGGLPGRGGPWGLHRHSSLYHSAQFVKRQSVNFVIPAVARHNTRKRRAPGFLSPAKPGRCNLSSATDTVSA